MGDQDISQWKVTVLGAGSMGQRITQFMAMNSHQVFLYNRTPSNLANTLVQMENNLQTLVSLGQIKAGDILDIMNRTAGSSNLRGSVEQADIAIENLAESEEIKKNILTQLDEYCNKDIILPSDTSTMDISSFLKMSHPERLVITHFFNPAHVMPLVELVRRPETSGEVAGVTKHFLEDTGKQVAVLSKYTPGLVLNRITLSMSRGAAHLVESGVATPEGIDKAVTSTFDPCYTLKGSFGLGDFTGTDIYERLVTLLPLVLCSDTECPKLLHKTAQEGKLGVKFDEGFYRHDDGKAARRDQDSEIMKMPAAIQEIGKRD